MKSAFFAGSFDPFTIGHQSLVERALTLFDRVVIGLGEHSGKQPDAPADVRREHIAALYAADPRVEVVVYGGLTATAARAHGCTHLLRGVRTAIDFEYERTLADANRNISGLETVLLYTLPELSFVSSSLVRELQHHGESASQFLPHVPK